MPRSEYVFNISKSLLKNGRKARHGPTSWLPVRPSTLAGFAWSLLLTSAAHAGIVVTVEAPTVQASSAVDTQTIDFDSQSTGYKGSQTFNLAGPLTATYSGDQFVIAADQYGGAGGIGNYLAIQSGSVVALNLSSAQAYFGMWLSAADSANQLEFYNGNQLVGAFAATTIISSLADPAYFGNPNPQFAGQNPDQPYVFLNFYAEAASDMFDKIVFINLPLATALESDNHTFSTTLQAPGAIPEPASLSIVGTLLLIVVSGRIRTRR